jgi:hypothetical protein
MSQVASAPTARTSAMAAASAMAIFMRGER